MLSRRRKRRERERERRDQLERLPAPRLAVPGYEAVGFWLLKARAKPGIAVEYNKALGELWAACTSTRTLPSPKQFEHRLAVVRQTLDAAYRQAATRPKRQELERATWALNRAEDEATEGGLLP